MEDNNEKKLDFEEIEIHSQVLKDLLAQTSPLWKDLVTGSDPFISARWPFHEFVWNWDAHQAACEPQKADSDDIRLAREDLRKALRLVRKCQTLSSYFRVRESLLKAKKKKVDFLWTLYGHATKVFARSYMDEWQMFEVNSCFWPPYKGRRFRITCSSLDWNGHNFSDYNYDFYIRNFTGEEPISSLNVIPIEYFREDGDGADSTQLRKRLIERGRKYFRLCTQEPITCQCEYQGPVLVSLSALQGLASKGRGNWSNDNETSRSSYDITIFLSSNQDRTS
jgi:hypothetical protein